MTMLGFSVARRSLKLYVMIIPLLLYLCLMYRLLESTCFEEGSDGDRHTNVYAHPDGPSRRIMQIAKGSNNTNLMMELAKEYEIIEDQRKSILKTLGNLIQDTNEELIGENELSKFRDMLNEKHKLQLSTNDKQFGDFVQYERIISPPRYLINCSNVHQIRLKTKIGHGVSKQALEGEYNGMPVAVKMVTRHQSEVKGCIEKLNDKHPRKDELRSRCFVFPTMRLMKEILLLEQLSHPGFVQLLGYCIRNEESDTTDLRERGIVSVFELGQRFLLHNTQLLTWQQRLKYAIQLAQFLNYLENSPLGSLRVRDFKEEHFLLVNGSIKMIDLDDVDNIEPACSLYVSHGTSAMHSGKGGSNGNKGCEFSLPCQRGLCSGFNAKQNMKFMNRIFFKRLLFPTVFPRIISDEVGYLLADLDDDKLSASMLELTLEHFLKAAQPS